MDEKTRDDMREWFSGTPEKSRVQAEGYIRDNVATALDPSVFETTVQDVLACDRAAWRAWLDRGNREDWADFVGVLNTPTLLVAGEKDGPLGSPQQETTARRHFSKAHVVTVPGAKHLLPLESPAEIAKLIAQHWRTIGGRESLVPADYLRLIRSDRTSARTRRILLDRLGNDAAGGTGFLTQDQFKGLEALVDRIVPQSGPRIPLARHIEISLAKGAGDGWRFATLAGDKAACLLGLQTLDAAAAECGGAFADLGADRQDGLLHKASNGTLGGPLDPEQMRRWFEDIRAEAVRAYVSHPVTLARIGYGGIANGGDGVRKQGFSVLHAGEREAWEPEGKAIP